MAGPAVEIRVAPFALPQNLEVAREIGRPARARPYPELRKQRQFATPSAARSQGISVADIPAVLAFYRRELAARGWKEEASGAVVTAGRSALNFSSTGSNRNAQARPQIRPDHRQSRDAGEARPRLAARAKAKKDADDKFDSDADAMVKADDGRGRGQARRAGRQPVGCAAARGSPTQTTPVPLPESAENVEFDGADGKLEFDSALEREGAGGVLPRTP